MYAQDRMRTVWFLFSKLREAQFAGKLEEFGFYLEALIPLARSVTHSLQKEFSNEECFKEWYPSIQAMMEKDEHFRYFNDKRNIILKKVAGVDMKDEFVVHAFFDGIYETKPNIRIQKDGTQISAKLYDSKDPTKEIPADFRINYRYYFEDKAEIQALVYVHEYLRKLEEIVLDCSKKLTESSE